MGWIIMPDGNECFTTATVGKVHYGDLVAELQLGKETTSTYRRTMMYDLASAVNNTELANELASIIHQDRDGNGDILKVMNPNFEI